ncbi:uncharacterized protein LOC100906633 [Galendromus occidentalis]|uniref:Uncharacterized protein LOC100906633 n=1 Tax=Galendromus occidentalis TaxID=34638 RepID=A0AAJ6QQH7_9ACAR|nr:uncharacterized protein LOC100906633 [Galendromus occidentalis]
MMKSALFWLILGVIGSLGVKALLPACDSKDFNETPFVFMVRMCETTEETKKFTKSLLSEVLTGEKAPNTHPILQEYVSHFDMTATGFCKELKAKHEIAWKEASKPEYPFADDIYHVLICFRDELKSFIDSNPAELQGLQESSLSELKWLVSNSERLHQASDKDLKNIE